MNAFIGTILVLLGLLHIAVARDRVLWVSYAIESFRWCNGMGCVLLGCRFWWIVFFGDEPGISAWAQLSLFSIAVGQLGLQINNVKQNTIHVPRFIRKSIE